MPGCALHMVPAVASIALHPLLAIVKILGVAVDLSAKVAEKALAVAATAIAAQQFGADFTDAGQAGLLGAAHILAARGGLCRPLSLLHRLLLPLGAGLLACGLA